MLGWKTIHASESPISGKIEVITNGTERRLRVGGITQSSDFLDGRSIGYWSGLVPDTPVTEVLLLGLGGGTVVKILRKRWPNVRIRSYEIDPEVVRVAKAFFGLNNIEVVIGDARHALSDDHSYDLVIVDLYLGNVAADFSEEDEFLQQIYDHLNPGGLASFNKYYGTNHRQRLNEVVAKTKQIFPEVWLQQNELNMVVWAKK